jgi:hypothetical protein
VELVEISLLDPSVVDSLQDSAPVELFTLSFNTVGLGTTPLSISVNALGDEFGNPVSPLDVINGEITVATPELSSLWPFAFGIFFIALPND